MSSWSGGSLCSRGSGVLLIGGFRCVHVEIAVVPRDLGQPSSWTWSTSRPCWCRMLPFRSSCFLVSSCLGSQETLGWGCNALEPRLPSRARQGRGFWTWWIQCSLRRPECQALVLTFRGPCGGWSNSIVERAFALHVTDLGSPASHKVPVSMAPNKLGPSASMAHPK